MKRIRASTFEKRCLRVLRNIQTTGDPVIVTENEKPIVKIVPIEQNTDDLFGFMAGEFEIVGDIESPVVPPSHWKIMKK